MIQIECCDNLELMSKIENGTVDLIYCDILYGTGRKFADYQDLKPIRSEIEAHYLPRLKEMHRVLKSTGSIYLHCDWHINHWIRCLLDDIFGYDRFVNEIIWSYRSGGRSASNYTSNHDTILLYSKTKKYTFNKQKDISYLPKMKGRVKFETVLNGYYAKCEHCDSENVAVRNVEARDVWEFNILSCRNSERTGYATQKPKELIERIIRASSNEGDLVADFYLGSGTTCEVALELGRKFIGCDINPRAVELSKKRCGVSF